MLTGAALAPPGVYQLPTDMGSPDLGLIPLYCRVQLSLLKKSEMDALHGLAVCAVTCCGAAATGCWVGA